jgi:hypothetical protein
MLSFVNLSLCDLAAMLLPSDERGGGIFRVMITWCIHTTWDDPGSRVSAIMAMLVIPICLYDMVLIWYIYNMYIYNYSVGVTYTVI